MKKVVLHIDSEGERREVTLENELSIGRTSQAQIVLPDSGLSRVNTTIFRDGDEVFVVDENSTNGTFINGEQVFTSPRLINDRDELTIGTNTLIYVEIFADKPVTAAPKPPTESAKITTAKKTKKTSKPKTPVEEKKLPVIPIVAGLSTFLIILFAVVAILIATSVEGDPGSGGKQTTQVRSDMLIPVRVIDPLGNEDPDDVEDLLASWENADKSVDAADLADVQSTMSSSPTNSAKGAELIVPIELFNKMIGLAKEPRSPSGERPPGMKVRPELCCGVPKQTRKLQQMVKAGYKQPLDYAELAEKRLNGDLIELPVATNIYVLDVGGNATEDEFTQFSWQTNPRSTKLNPGDAKYQTLKRLADDFDGQKYDLNNPKHRKQMKIRLLRMFNKRAKPILERFAAAYQQKFNRPLRITSLTRSMEYQISLNANNANSFKVSGEGSLPPHTSGCAFDLARKQMTTDEQNFMIETLAGMENEGILDALIEYHVNSCFHIFIYDDGRPPA